MSPLPGARHTGLATSTGFTPKYPGVGEFVEVVPDSKVVR